MSAERHEDPQLGTLVWNAERETWECSIGLSWFSSFDISIDNAKTGAPLRHLSVAHRVVDFIRDPDRPLIAFIADELIDTYNGTWNTGRPVSRQRFCRRIKPDGLSVFANGAAWVFFTDGGFFRNHAIVINIDEDGNKTDARLAG